MRSFFRTLLGLGVLLMLLPANAQDSATTVRGGGISFLIPSPDAQMVETGPDYRVLLEPFAPNTNRLMAAFLTHENLNLLQAGRAPNSDSYALVEILRSIEFRNVTDKDFEELNQVLLQQFKGNLTQELDKGFSEAKDRIKSISGAEQNYSLEKPTPLGQLFAKPNATGFGIAMPITGNGVTMQKLCGTAIVKVKNRVLFLYLYVMHKDEKTLPEMSKELEQWADALLKSNS